jgi:cobalt-precorrin 5A hydrolase
MGGRKAVSARLIAGVGCRRDCPAETIVAVVRFACGDRTVHALACPAWKAAAIGVRTAAERLGIALLAVERDALAAVQDRCVTRSAHAEAAVGIASVAEGCALAAGGAGARLLVPRVTGNGATCAIAEAPSS